MARTDDEIRNSLVESLRTIDPSVDVDKGPIFNFLLRPVPTELQKTEADAERLTILTTLQLDQVATQEEVEAMATSFSIRLGGGRASRTTNQLFFTFSRPTQDIVLNRGILVGSEDQRFTYFVTEAVTLPAATADNFFNPQTRRYEIFASCEATATGEDFDLPPTRVRQIITTIDGIDGTTNTKAYAGGTSEPTLNNSVDRIRAKFAGLDPETGGGIKSDIRNFDPENVLDVSLVYPKDRAIFRRRTNRPAIDAYVLGDDVRTIDETFVGVGGETQLALQSRPVESVSAVVVNSVALVEGTDYDFIRDVTPETRGSPRSTDFVLLTTPLIAADVAVVTQSYNALLQEMQDDLFGFDRPFETDVLARGPVDIGLAISVDATVLASTDTARAFVAIENALFTAVEQGRFIDVLEPEIVRQEIKDAVGGLSNLRLTRFRRTLGSTREVETVTLKKNEVPFIDQNALDIKVRR